MKEIKSRIIFKNNKWYSIVIFNDVIHFVPCDSRGQANDISINLVRSIEDFEEYFR